MTYYNKGDFIGFTNEMNQQIYGYIDFISYSNGDETLYHVNHIGEDDINSWVYTDEIFYCVNPEQVIHELVVL